MFSIDTATLPFHNRLAVVFDFDETLAPDSFRVLLESIGVGADRFSKEWVGPLLKDGWEKTLAKMYCLVEESEGRDDVEITMDYLNGLGRDIDLYDGVPEMFDRVRDAACEVVPDIEVEFYLLTGRFVEIVRGTAIANRFRETWGSEYHFGEGGEVAFAKRFLTHPEKARYLLQLSKGLDDGAANGPSDVYREVPQDELRVPLNQIVYVGDGSSDMPAFSLLNGHDGVAIGVYHSDTVGGWSGRSKMREGRRVQNLVPADYAEGSELMRSLMLAVEGICKRIALRRLGAGE